MNPREFYNAVVEMRKAQKNYFATKKFPLTARQHLEESKRLERIVDAEIERVNKMEIEQKSPKIEFE